MRISILTPILFYFLQGSLSAQTITINTTLGSTTFAVSEISKMSYNNDSLFISLNTNSVVSYPLSSVINHTFSQNSTGLNDIISSRFLKVFPNPSNSVLNFQFSLIETKTFFFEFFDQSGRSVYKSPLSKYLAGASHTELDICSSLNNYKGLLFVKVIDEDNTVMFLEKITIF